MTLDGHLTIRFPPDLVAAAKHFAAAQGMDVSAWIRREVERELSRREGRCSHCGQEIPPSIPADAKP